MGQIAANLAGAPTVGDRWAPAEQLAAVIDLRTARRRRPPSRLGQTQRPADRPRCEPVPMRLTTRGRVVLRLAVFTVLVAVAFGLAQLVTGAGNASDPPTPRASLRSVVVHEGDTLWSIAVQHRPSADPRATMEQIRQLNGMRTATVEEGQEIVLPPR